MPALGQCTISITYVEFWVRSQSQSESLSVGYNKENLESNPLDDRIIFVALFSKSFPVL